MLECSGRFSGSGVMEGRQPLPTLDVEFAHLPGEELAWGHWEPRECITKRGPADFSNPAAATCTMMLGGTSIRTSVRRPSHEGFSCTFRPKWTEAAKRQAARDGCGGGPTLLARAFPSQLPLTDPTQTPPSILGLFLHRPFRNFGAAPSRNKMNDRAKEQAIHHLISTKGNKKKNYTQPVLNSTSVPLIGASPRPGV